MNDNYVKRVRRDFSERPVLRQMACYRGQTDCSVRPVTLLREH